MVMVRSGSGLLLPTFSKWASSKGGQMAPRSKVSLNLLPNRLIFFRKLPECLRFLPRHCQNHIIEFLLRPILDRDVHARKDMGIFFAYSTVFNMVLSQLFHSKVDVNNFLADDFADDIRTLRSSQSVPRASSTRRDRPTNKAQAIIELTSPYESSSGPSMIWSPFGGSSAVSAEYAHAAMSVLDTQGILPAPDAE